MRWILALAVAIIALAYVDSVEAGCGRSGRLRQRFHNRRHLVGNNAQNNCSNGSCSSSSPRVSGVIGRTVNAFGPILRCGKNGCN